MNELLRRLLYLPPQASRFAADIDALHYFVILTTMLGAALVFSVATWWLLRFRRRGRELPATPTVTAPLLLELAIIAGTLGLFLAWWIIGFTQYLEQRSPPRDAQRVYVTGKQWMWRFSYPDGQSSLDALTLRANEPVELVITSRDVIHSFAIPAFRVKQDAVPGAYTRLWLEPSAPGVYPVLCAEFCGLEHSRMLARVVVLDEADYRRFLEGARARAAVDEGGDMVAQGLAAAARHGCLACHTVDGRPHLGPTWAGSYGRARELEEGAPVVVDDAYLTRSMMDPLAEIARGFAPVMPSYQGVLSAAESAALVELIRSLREGPAP